MSLAGRVGIFLVFPLVMGAVGLYFSHLEAQRKPEKVLSVARDFAVPFLLALAVVVVIGLRTEGYAQTNIDPLAPWSKVERVRTAAGKAPNGYAAAAGKMTKLRKEE